jgi:hypothetical protein
MSSLLFKWRLPALDWLSPAPTRRESPDPAAPTTKDRTGRRDATRGPAPSRPNDLDRLSLSLGRSTTDPYAELDFFSLSRDERGPGRRLM